MMGISAVGRVASGASLGKIAFNTLTAIPSEILQELYIDPYIENYVSKTVERAGGSFWEQVLWSSLAEGARETLTGSVFSALKKGFSGNSLLNDMHTDHVLRTTMKHSSIESQAQVSEMKDSLQTRSLKDTGGQLVMSTLMLFSGFLMGTFVPVAIAGSLAPVVSIMVSSRVAKDYPIKPILEDTVDIQAGLVPQPMQQWHFEFSDATQAVWYHDLEQSLLDETRVIDESQRTIPTQDMIDSLVWLSEGHYYDSSLGEEVWFDGGQPQNFVEQRDLLGKLVSVTFGANNEPLTAAFKYAEDYLASSKMGRVIFNLVKEHIRNLYVSNELQVFRYQPKVHDRLYVSKYLDKDFIKINKEFIDISNDPKKLSKHHGRVYFIRFARDMPYLHHKELQKIGPKRYQRNVEYIGATKNFGQRMYNRIKNAIFYPKLTRKQSIKNALILAFDMIGLDTQKIRDKWRELSPGNKWGLVQDIIKILEDFGFIFEVIEYQERYESAFSREKHWIKTKDTFEKGLNRHKGGGGMGRLSQFPLYDIAFLISLGANPTIITQYLNSEYKAHFKKQIKKSYVKGVIDFIWGRFYDA